MADPPDDDDFLGGFSEDERSEVDKARERIQREQANNVVKLDEKRKRKPKPPPEPPPGGWPAWRDKLAKDDRGRIIADLDNVLVALDGEHSVRLAIAYDEMLQHSLVMLEWPKVAEFDGPERTYPHEVDDDDITRLQQWLQRMGIRRIGREIVGQAVEHLARRRRFHPVRDGFEMLAWDGVPKLDTWMFSYLGAVAESAEEIEYVRMIGAMFLIAMVARIYRPGCQCDYMLVLEGEQGILKSSACRVLAGDYFSDSLPDAITSKDARQHLRGKHLVEVSELAAFSKTEVEALKAFITRREEKYRPPFGRHDVMEPRQGVLVGTTNQHVYIKDSTGARRFWPIRCTTIDVEGLRAVRDQLFAEAVFRFKRGDRWWPTAADEERFFKPQQAARLEDDPWKGPIARYLESMMSERVTPAEIAKMCLGFVGDSRITPADGRRIANVMRELEWPYKHTMKGGAYLRPKSEDDR
jgi:predicted P-loop ATPase